MHRVTKWLRAARDRASDAPRRQDANVVRTSRFYSSGIEIKGPSPVEAKLESLFDSLRGIETAPLPDRLVFFLLIKATDDKNDEKDKLELESTMGYLSNELHISLENAELFVALELVQAPSVGEIHRKGYVEGWKRSGYVISPCHPQKAGAARRKLAYISSA